MSPSIRFISAGAGSGKTYRLTELLHEMLSAGKVNAAGVIATSFTKKAAAELRERVRSHLSNKGQHALATAIGQAQIGTVNSVCGALLARFTFEAGLPPEQRVLDEDRAQQVLKEAIDLVTEGQSLADFLAAARRLGLGESVRQQAIPWQKAFREIVDSARANGIDPEVLRTLGSENADRLLAYFPRVSATDLDVSLRQSIETALPAIKNTLSGPKPKQNTTNYAELLEGVLGDLNSGELVWSQWPKLAKESPEKGLLTVAQPIADAAALHAAHPRLHADVRLYLQRLFSLAADSLAAYAARKRQLGAMDFADQERTLLDILDDPQVREALRDELDLLMVDEFQDTSPIQLALFLKLAHLAKHVVWVGDIKQAIYGFRGGDTALMQAVVKSLPGLGGSKETLPHSYRSRPTLVNWVNDLFGTAFTGLVPQDIRLSPIRTEITATPAVEDWLLDGAAPDQHQSIASGIASLVNEGFQVVDRKTNQPRAIRLGDIAVLARSNSTVKEIAATLSERQIPSATAQPGLLSQPEIVLALACLRRLNDESDTIATAEIVSLGECEDPDVWLSDRLEWINKKGEASAWRDAGAGPRAPIFAALQALRAERPVLSPREAVELVFARCRLTRQVLQWQTSVERGRRRLANLDRLLGYADEYEEDCRTNREAATLSGFLLWMQELEQAKLDHLPQGRDNAVQIMTHHGAKGLEWPVVILVDLSGKVLDSIWDSVRAESRTALNAEDPLRDRFLRYWPWPYGQQAKVPVADDVETSLAGQIIRRAAIEEHKRLLYVSFTRARDLIVIARPKKALNGEWMATIGLAQRIPFGDAQSIVLSDGTQVPFRGRALSPMTANLPDVVTQGNVSWFAGATSTSPRLPLVVSPSAAGETPAFAAEVVELGSRIDTSKVKDRSIFGEAVHACIAADLVSSETGLNESAVRSILERFGVADMVSSTQVVNQLKAIRVWLKARWPGATPWVELPVSQALPNGQRLSGRIDLLLRTVDGWVLLDHKSTSQSCQQAAEMAAQHGGQLAAYREAIEAVTHLAVQETWLVLPVAGAAIRVCDESATYPRQLSTGVATTQGLSP
jgi:ATP-dependent exoDNAse (exonuclease V) beta subunit